MSATYAPGSVIRDRIAEIDASLAEMEKQFKPLKTERKALDAALKNIERALNGTSASSNGSTATAVSDEDIIRVLTEAKTAGDGAQSAKQVGERLGVSARNVARKLRKLVDEGKATGDKDAGYLLNG